MPEGLFFTDLLIFTLIPFFNCFAQIKNPLIGNWRWSSSSCKHPDFTFSENKIIQSLDVDGTPQAFTYDKIKYEVTALSVTVDFGKRHSFGKTPDKQKLTFKIQDENHLILNRKLKSMNDFYRCP